MGKNRNLVAAKVAKNDEFYTQYSDIEKEVVHFQRHFKDAKVFCNCDNPEWSNFWKYFYDNFESLGLKSLTTIHYDSKVPVYKLEYFGNGEPVKTPLMTNGDFRSPESVEVLKESDIVVTNPPFSLFREFINQLMTYGKKFLILGNLNEATCGEIFPLLKNRKIWYGVNNNQKYYRVPEGYKPREGEMSKIIDGQLHIGLGNTYWYTNMEYEGMNDFIDLVETYSPEKYPKYDEYDAIEVSRTVDIPYDYDGKMGVPITFLGKYTPEQFEIMNLDIFMEDNPHPGKRFTINGETTYARIIIKNLNHANYGSN